MITFPNCKINLGLKIINKRADGFHNIETVLYPVKWCDAVEAIPSSNFSFQQEGLVIDGNKNLCVKAYKLLEKEYGIPPVNLCLLKNIPVGAGLGGGSSDAAFTLRLLSDLFQLKLSEVHLKQLATQLGSDCAFFIDNKPSIATGKGEQLDPVTLDLSSLNILIVYPEIHIDTAWAYGEWVPAGEIGGKVNNHLRATIVGSMENWREELKNDFEEIVFRKYPEIELVKNTLYREGALYASLSGSGSAVYGIFRSAAPEIKWAKGYRTFSGRLD